MASKASAFTSYHWISFYRLILRDLRSPTFCRNCGNTSIPPSTVRRSSCLRHCRTINFNFSEIYERRLICISTEHWSSCSCLHISSNGTLIHSWIRTPFCICIAVRSCPWDATAPRTAHSCRCLVCFPFPIFLVFCAFSIPHLSIFLTASMIQV